MVGSDIHLVSAVVLLLLHNLCHDYRLKAMILGESVMATQVELPAKSVAMTRLYRFDRCELSLRLSDLNTSILDCSVC